MGKKLPLLRRKNLSNTKETYSNYNLLSISSSHRALIFCKQNLNVYDINDYIIGSFMYECLYGTIPEIFRNYFQRNVDVHDHNLRNTNDLYVPYGRLDIRKFRIKIAGANLWNSLPSFVKNSQSIHIFKKNMRHYLVERKRYT